MSKKRLLDTIIIGAGIAGMTAAIYASRKRMSFQIVASGFGGQLSLSSEILNYPGIVQTTGEEFAKTMKEQMRFNDVKVKEETVKSIISAEGHYRIVTDKSEYESKTVIIATGSVPRKLGVKGESEFTNKGVAYCAICDGPLFAGKDVAVIGGGNSALEATDFLKDIANRIYVIVDDDKLIAHEYLIERVKGNPKIEIIFNAKTTEITGDRFVKGLKYGQDKKIDVQGVFVEIGRLPATDIFKDLVELDEHGHIIIDCQARTSSPGIFAAGDCASGHEYQYVIAAGQGCMALIKAARYISDRNM